MAGGTLRVPWRSGSNAYDSTLSQKGLSGLSVILGKPTTHHRRVIVCRSYRFDDTLLGLFYVSKHGPRLHPRFPVANSAPDVKALSIGVADLTQEAFCNSTGTDVSVLATVLNFRRLFAVYHTKFATSLRLLLLRFVRFDPCFYAFTDLVRP